jgi:O-antigen ligase
MHPAYFSLLVVMALVGAFWLRQQGLFPGRWYWVGQSWLLVFLLLLSARMTLLAFGFSSLLMLMHYGYRSGRIRLLLSSLLGALAFALAVFFILPERLQQRFTELTQFEYDITAPLLTDFNGLTIRLAEWRGVLVAMDGHFWLGHGTGAGYEALQAANAQTGFQVGIDYNYNAHNQWLEGALSNGFVSILLLMAIFVLAFHHARTQGNWLGMWFLIFFFFCIQSESMLIRHRGALFFALYLSLALLAGSLTKSASRPASRD